MTEDAAPIRRLAIPATALTSATVLGMLLGFGRRYSTAWPPLNAAAHTVLGMRADDVWGFKSDVTLVGGAVVLVVSAVAGVVIVELTSSHRTLHSALAAFGVALRRVPRSCPQWNACVARM